MSADSQPRNNRGLLIALVTGVFAVVAIGAAALLVNISERKSEAKHAYVKVVDGNCRRCHEDVAHGGDVSCVRCHPSVGHLR